VQKREPRPIGRVTIGMQADRNGHQWSREEVETLGRLVNDGMAIVDIAKALQRTKLGVKLRRCNRAEALPAPAPDRGPQVACGGQQASGLHRSLSSIAWPNSFSPYRGPDTPRRPGRGRRVRT
jgi:hypothetical protein